MIASVSGNGLQIFEVDSMSELRPTARSEVPGAQCLSWNHTNQVVAVGGTSDSIHLVQVHNGEYLSTIPFNDEDAFSGVVRAVAFSNNSRYLASSAENVVNLWDLKRRQLKATFTGHRGAVSCLSISVEGDIISGDESGAVRIWDIKSGNSSPEMLAGDGEGGIRCIGVSRTGPPRISCGYSSGIATLWDYHRQGILWTEAAHRGEVTDVSFSPRNSRLLITAGQDGNVNLYDTATSTGVPNGSIRLGADAPTAISAHDDGTHIAIGTQSGSVLYYDWRNCTVPLFEVPDAHAPYPVTALHFPPTPKPASSSAPSTPSRGGAVGVGEVPRSAGVKKPVATRSPARVGGGGLRAREAPSAVQTSAGSMGSTMSSLSASTGLPLQQQQQQYLLQGGRVETVWESQQSGQSAALRQSAPLSESTTPPRSPVHSPNRKNKDNNKTTEKEVPSAAAAAAASGDSRAVLASVTARMDEYEREGRQSVESAASSQKGEEESSAVAHNLVINPPQVVSATAQAAPGTAPRTPPRSGDNDSIQSRASSGSRGVSTQASGGGSRYSRAYVDSLISARLSHRDQGQGSAVKSGGRDGDASVIRASSAEMAGDESTTVYTSAQQQQRQPPNSVASSSRRATDEEVEAVRHGTQALTSQEMQEALQVLKYDIHRDIRSVITEQSRQFALYREDMTAMVAELKGHLDGVLSANAELRKENERLRHIY